MAETRDDEHLGRSSGRLKDAYSRCGIQFGTRSRLSKPITIDRARACPRCGGHAICRWGSDRRGRPRWCCRGCARTFCGSTGTVLAGLRAPDAFGCVLKDMLGDMPSSCRKLAAELRVDKTTVWEWRRKIVQGLLTERRMGSTLRVEISPRPIRESRKGSREWVRHACDSARFSAPNRPRWIDVDRRLLRLPLPLAAYQIRVLVNVDRLGSHPQIIPFKPTVPKPIESVPFAADSMLVAPAAAGHSDASEKVKHCWPVAGCEAGCRTKRSRPGGENYRPELLDNDDRAALDLTRGPLPSVDAPCHANAAPCFGERKDALEESRERFAQFLRPFRGPAAKYLRGYVAWFIARLHDDEAGRLTAAWERLSCTAALDRPTLSPDMLRPVAGPP